MNENLVAQHHKPANPIKQAAGDWTAALPALPDEKMEEMKLVEEWINSDDRDACPYWKLVPSSDPRFAVEVISSFKGETTNHKYGLAIYHSWVLLACQWRSIR